MVIYCNQASIQATWIPAYAGMTKIRWRDLSSIE
jgi:hypothetical protein